jgi:hypothetical protein
LPAPAIQPGTMPGCGGPSGSGAFGPAFGCRCFLMSGAEVGIRIVNPVLDLYEP